MKSTLGLSESIPPFIGVDLTDRYARRPRPIDVCGLTPRADGGFAATFWKWHWPAPEEPLGIEAILREVTAADATMLDGPQALCFPGVRMRECERICGAAGKTPDTLPQQGRAYQGYVRSSVELFTAFHTAHVQISPNPERGGVGEVYPGGIWRRLTSRRIPGKKHELGRQARKEILSLLGVLEWPHENLPSDDENDACVAALMAAAARGAVPGMGTHGIGIPLMVIDGQRREGELVMPSVDEQTKHRISANFNTPEVPVRVAAPARTLDPAALGRAERLLAWLAALAAHGDPRLCTYKDAWQHLFQPDAAMNWGQSRSSKVTELATSTSPIDVPGLGSVRLDSFIVTDAAKRPGEGHWGAVEYTEDDWDRVLGCGEWLEIYP